jgi:hypothetical protein
MQQFADDVEGRSHVSPSSRSDATASPDESKSSTTATGHASPPKDEDGNHGTNSFNPPPSAEGGRISSAWKKLRELTGF